MSSMRRVTVLLVVLIATISSSYAQYYSWGADRSSLKWSRLKGDRYSIIYPDTVEFTARRMMHYIDAAQQSEAFGFEYPALNNIPFVVHPENFVSNGMVMWAPLRIEFLSTPAIDGFSMPWVKQLVAHEYRHAVQYNNLDQSTLKVYNYIFGEQGAAVSLLFSPLYALEGDAVMMETQMSTYGRGLQPSFSIAYRALADEILTQGDFLKWRCGSYRQDIPNHYNMGYQMMSYAYDKYNENILDKAFAYVARNPQFIVPYSITLRNEYNTSTKKLFYETFSSLVEFWKPLSEVEDSAERLSEVEKNNVITYSTPTPLESGELLALKTDYKEPYRFVLFDPATSTERVVAHTGYVSSRPAYGAGRVWWSEYRRSALYAEDYNSQLCYMDLEQGRPKSLKGHKNALYPTPMGDVADHVAYVEYNPTGQYSVVELIGAEVVDRTDVAYPNEVHGMAWDDATQSLYIIVTGDEGMWIEKCVDGGFQQITKAAYITISSLSASDGVLYFGSIASGKDEIHSLDLSSGVERQLTESKYGSFSPVAQGNQLYVTTYDKYGYHIARQDAETYICEVEYSNIPKTVVNPQRKKWDVINLDTVSFSVIDAQRATADNHAKRYRKSTHLFNIHSWAPISYNPYTILGEQVLDIGLGLTAVSQNLLSSCSGFVSYGWDHYDGSIFKAGVEYIGLGVNLYLSGSYGGNQNLYLLSSSEGIALGKYKEVALSATLPLYFSRGYHSRSLSVYSGWSYSNGIVPSGLETTYSYDPMEEQFSTIISYSDLKEGLNKFSFGVSYSDYVQSATRDLTTPFGYATSVSYALDPTNSEFSHLVALYGKLYTPGLAQNNSFTLAAAYQNAIGGYEIMGYRPLSYLTSLLIPHGFTTLDISNNKYLAASAEYSLPLCYPEVGLFDLLYIKRLSIGVGGDYASFNNYVSGRSTIYSYGVNLMTDLNALSMSSSSTMTLTLSLYKPTNKSLYFQFGIGLPI